MRQFDLTPLYRSAIGFDRLASMIDNASRNEQAQNGYPPYNIELINEYAYRITMAIAGFDKSEVTIKTEHGVLSVTGNKQADETERQYLHQGIAARGFERKFQLADHVRVTDASMENGLLHIDLIQEIPEEMKPRSIEIN
ncbi:Hsp20 family protein [Amphritea sp. 2_MG-2023]|jgi:molecular chaperone IbpA|uniref:Hsp20 family protein n=1 Tax=Amphritea TaxID=515417 RepID=UPI001C067AC3|nr:MULTISPECIES: Hsp20 family protein [Amphritea]MBU2964499.1 Hsp20 family protein [Amphritea atlantica]MDO6417827.1 Hsp20 family protein [Amphritea sp. 2_MG-2023]MDX2421515.1 Hsp20 family protein [Amphritea sp.]